MTVSVKDPRSIVHKDPIWQLFSIITLPIWGKLNLFLFSYLKPNPVCPIIVPDFMTTSSPTNVLLNVTFDPIWHLFPILTFELIITLFPILTFLPISTVLSIKVFLPIKIFFFIFFILILLTYSLSLEEFG